MNQVRLDAFGRRFKTPCMPPGGVRCNVQCKYCSVLLVVSFLQFVGPRTNGRSNWGNSDRVESTLLDHSEWCLAASHLAIDTEKCSLCLLHLHVTSCGKEIMTDGLLRCFMAVLSVLWFVVAAKDVRIQNCSGNPMCQASVQRVQARVNFDPLPRAGTMGLVLSNMSCYQSPSKCSETVQPATMIHRLIGLS